MLKKSFWFPAVQGMLVKLCIVVFLLLAAATVCFHLPANSQSLRARVTGTSAVLQIINSSCQYTGPISDPPWPFPVEC